jgi:3-hydroxymyristoyl/3-hydroxydecanoyl-(acyl carrier protein) dehydratase
VVVARVALPNGVVLQLDVPTDLVWFDGHFPGDPILPGVTQIGWAIAFAREHFGLNADPHKIDRVKFLQPTRPGARLELKLVGEATCIRWQLYENTTLLSCGHLTFETP